MESKTKTPSFFLTGGRIKVLVMDPAEECWRGVGIVKVEPILRISIVYKDFYAVLNSTPVMTHTNALIPNGKLIQIILFNWILAC